MPGRARTLLPLGLCLAAAALPACKRKAPAARPAAVDAARPLAAAAPACPDGPAIAPLLGVPAADLRTGCFAFPHGGYWMAAALSGLGAARAAGTPPRLQLLAGSPATEALAFEVEPAPTDALVALVRGSADVEVTLRAGRSGQGLVRLGIAGRRGSAERPASEEILLVFQLTAHKPPGLVWSGRGDEVATGDDGCVSERRVSVESLFGNRLEVYTTHGARRLPGTPGGPCQAGLGAQESFALKAQPLKAGRRLPAAAPGRDGGR
jgi:hypothetical protein